MKIVCSVAGALLFAGLLGAQSTASNPGDLTIQTGIQEVLLDFVARDKHQRIVTDLQPGEVEVYEDGILQHPNSFRYRGSLEASVSPNSPVPPGKPYDALRELNVISIVFENMSAQSRRRGTEFVDEFLTNKIDPNTWMGVFTLNRQLSVIQPYTLDLGLIQKAVTRAGSGAYQQFAAESLEIIKRINSLEAVQTPDKSAKFQPFSPGSAEERGPAGGIGRELAAVEATFQRLTLKALYQQSGFRSVDALRSLVRAQHLLPGRKTILYVSEGLVVPPSQPELLRAVIGEANRNNVTFYALDARGLETTSGLDVSKAASTALNDADQQSAPAVQQTNLQENARQLSEGTGGFAMDNSNDLRSSLRRVMEDVRAHYEIAYTPTSPHLDGRFRAISIKALRPGLKLQSRKGYFALPFVNGEPLSLAEVAALKALNTSPVPRAFNFQCAALRLGANEKGTEYRIAFSALGKAVGVREDSSSKMLQVHLSALALVKNAAPQSGAASPDNEVVSRVWRDLPYQFPASRRSGFANGEITLGMPLVLPAGHYRVEAALLDVEAGTASVRTFSLVVPHPPPADRVDASDIVWVRSVTATDPHSEPDSLDTPSGHITPELAPDYALGTNPSFFFKVRAVPGVTSRMFIIKDGRVLRVLDLALPPGDPSGVTSFLGELPAVDLPAGEYDVNLSVRSGSTELTRPSRFALRAADNPHQ